VYKLKEVMIKKQTNALLLKQETILLAQMY